MLDFAAARRTMVDSQVRTNDVTDPRIVAAMLELPRERFVAQGKADLAYADLHVPVSVAPSSQPMRRLLKPMVLAKLAQAAEITASDHVVDVGCASGYSAALLARLARSGGALAEDAARAKPARENLAARAAPQATVG